MQSFFYSISLIINDLYTLLKIILATARHCVKVLVLKVTNNNNN
jgi:hypothetical protein